MRLQETDCTQTDSKSSAIVSEALSPFKLKFQGTDTDTLADFCARMFARKSACSATSPFSLPRARHARQSSLTCLPTRPTRAHARILFFARLSVRDARVHTYTVHDKLSCTRLQNYTIGASVSVSVSVS